MRHEPFFGKASCMSIYRKHTLECDVLVAGGGPAGVPCAVAAARAGSKVILCQDRPVLGGNASSEVRMHIVGADNSGSRGAMLETETREGGIIEEIRLETSVRNPQRSASMLDLVLYELCRAEPNLTLMLNTRVTDVEMEEGRIARAIAERPSTEDHFTIAAKVFVDCTGDGQLGVAAGAPYRHGRESREEYGESLAQEVADGKTLGSTLLFQARNLGVPTTFTPPPWARKITEADLQHRPHGLAGLDRGLEYGYWWMEWGGELDTIRDNEHIRDELLAILMGVWDHIKNGGDHGAENWALDWFGFLPGKRESRRFLAQYMLRQDDLLPLHDGEHAPAKEDAIAYGGWPIDIHPPEGIDDPQQEPFTPTRLPEIFDIPLRSCISAGPSNLMFAGRNIGATHVAFASTRVMATCAVVGQGVGVAAAYAAQHDVEPTALAGDAAARHAIQQRLLREDAYLIGVLNSDKNDLARGARVSASSAQDGGEAQNVLSGQTRAVHGKWGAPPERAHAGAHRWMSDPAQRLPAWLEVRWEKPVSLGLVQVVFDAGMHRPLTLSHSDGYQPRMQWGRAQAETVRDYEVEVEVDGAWQTVASVQGNYQRRRVHEVLGGVEASAVRIVVKATNGIDHARICEVRAYAPNAPVWS